jgi:hypothetical protein
VKQQEDGNETVSSAVCSYRDNKLEILTGVRLLHDDVEVSLPQDRMNLKLFPVMLRQYRQRIQFVILKSCEIVWMYELGENGGHLVAPFQPNGILGKIEVLNTLNALSRRSKVNLNGRLSRQVSIS